MTFIHLIELIMMVPTEESFSFTIFFIVISIFDSGFFPRRDVVLPEMVWLVFSTFVHKEMMLRYLMIGDRAVYLIMMNYKLVCIFERQTGSNVLLWKVILPICIIVLKAIVLYETLFNLNLPSPILFAFLHVQIAGFIMNTLVLEW